MALDPNAKDPVDAKIAPATARIVVTDSLPEEPLVGDMNADDVVDMKEVTIVLQMINGMPATIRGAEETGGCFR